MRSQHPQVKSPGEHQLYPLLRITGLKLRCWPGLQFDLKLRVLFQPYQLLAEFISLLFSDGVPVFSLGLGQGLFSEPRGFPQILSRWPLPLKTVSLLHCDTGWSMSLCHFIFFQSLDNKVPRVGYIFFCLNQSQLINNLMMEMIVFTLLSTLRDFIRCVHQRI